jgi:hypothetical protein
MENQLYVAMISGGSLKEPRFEKFEITENDVQEFIHIFSAVTSMIKSRREEISVQDAIDSLKEDYISSFEQSGGKVILLTEEQFNGIFNFVGEFLKKE